LAQDGVDPHFISGNEHGPFRWQKQIDWHQDQPTFGPNFAMIWSIYQSASKQDVRVLLDGHDGDTTVSYGDRYIHELASAGRWLRLATELRGLSQHHGGSTWKSLRAFWWHYGIDPLFEKHRPLLEMRRVWRGAKRRVAGESVKPARSEGWRVWLNPEFASQINMSERYRAWRQTISRTARTERQAHFRMLSHPMQAFALEVHDSAAAAFGIEARYPFWDKRLVEFCLGMPPEQKLHKGWTRIVLRRAMKGILPSEIQWRAGKMDFTPSLAYGLRCEQDLLDDIIMRNPDIIERYINIPKLRQAYRRFLNQDSQVGSADIFAIWKAASLASWLQNAWPPARHPTERGAHVHEEEVMAM
jgi:asparagine synthase (glutamine-hydrolysing)